MFPVAGCYTVSMQSDQPIPLLRADADDETLVVQSLTVAPEAVSATFSLDLLALSSSDEEEDEG